MGKIIQPCKVDDILCSRLTMRIAKKLCKPFTMTYKQGLPVMLLVRMLDCIGVVPWKMKLNVSQSLNNYRHKDRTALLGTFSSKSRPRRLHHCVIVS